MFTKELGHDQRLADVGRTVQQHAGHAFSLRGVQEPLQALQRLRRTWVVDPAVCPQRPHPLLVVEVEHLPRCGMKVGALAHDHFQISTA